MAALKRAFEMHETPASHQLQTFLGVAPTDAVGHEHTTAGGKASAIQVDVTDPKSVGTPGGQELGQSG